MNVNDWYNGGQTEKLKDLNIFYRREGKGPVLVCIHGFPSSSWDFEAIWPSLTNHFDVIASDLIGLGKSAKPHQKLTVELQADMIEELLARLKIQEAHLLAHDLGDTVAQELLARQKAGLSKVKWHSCVFMNGGIFPETHQPLLIQKLLISPIGRLLAPLTSEQTFQKNMTNIFSVEHPPSDEYINETWNLITIDKGKQMIPRLIRYMAERKSNREQWVGPLTDNLIPICLINGVQDPISGEHAAKRFEEVVPNAKVYRIKDAGHYPHVETPEKVLEAFHNFHNLE